MSFAELLFVGAATGLGATIVLDLFAVLRQGWAPTHGFYCLVGRWVGLLPQNGLFHDDIRSSAPLTSEAMLGWGAHILLGVVYGVAFAIIFGMSAIVTPQLWQGLSFGLATVLVPWLIFQPLFGWGLGMSKAPDPWKMRMKGVINHTVFGLGIWLSITLLNGFFVP
ncbi:DUF2938 family protein [Alphaproteobacteria bacterium KMM 3653]|uniref:DUF2938 family protein n=1 Tax=Harenicola maris TaxID=2841044 RepID=A0AAP2CSU7_9RHOB|nr:DUF2938 family protein [Harenicola maris]